MREKSVDCAVRRTVCRGMGVHRLSRLLGFMALLTLVTACSCPEEEGGLSEPTEDVIPTDDTADDVGREDTGGTTGLDDAGVDDAGGETTGDDVDASSQCTEDEDCAEVVAAGACERAACTDGVCLAVPLDDGTDCDDGDGCTTGTVCTAGICGGGSPTDCNDDNPCTVDACEDGACVSTPDNGTVCDDGNECTEGDSCFGGDCKSGTNTCVELCDNGVDDDLNGATDCEDFSCAASDDCLEVCTLIGTLQCDSSVQVDLDDVVGSSKIDSWGCAGLTLVGEELGYAFVAVESVTATVTLADAPEGAALFQLSDTATACDKKFCTASSTTSVSFLATPDSAPTLVVDTPADSEGQIALEVTCEQCTPDCNGKVCGGDGCGGVCGMCSVGTACSSGACVAAPDNEDCNTPNFIAPNELPAYRFGDTSAAKDDYFLPTGNPCTGGASAGLGGRDVVYSFTPSSTGEYIVVLDAEYDSTLYIVTDCDAPGDTCEGVSSSIGTEKEQVVTTLNQGVTYLIVVDGASSFSSGPYALTINTFPCDAVCGGKDCGPDACGGSCGVCSDELSCTEEGLCLALADNDTCASPSSIVSLPYSGSGTTVAAADDYVVFPEVCPGGPAFGLAGAEAPDLVYELSVSEAGKYRITLIPDAGFDALLSVRSGCPGTSQQCLAGSEILGDGAEEFVEVVLAASESVYVIVDGAGPGEAGGFDLTIEKIACTPQCAGKSCGPDGCGATCGDCGTGDICSDIGTCVAVSPNDTCATATVIPSLPFNDSGSLFGANGDYVVSPNSCSGGPTSATYGAGPDVAYSYTATSNQTVKFSFDQGLTDFITYLFAVKDCDDPASFCTASPVSATPGGSVLLVPMLAGESIYVIVSGWSANDVGNFTFFAEEN